MAMGYWIAQVDVADTEKYKACIQANAMPLRKFGAKLLLCAGRFDSPEGTSRSRSAVIASPTYQAALDCRKSPDYQEALKLRVRMSTVDLVIIEGDDGPQPSRRYGIGLDQDKTGGSDGVYVAVLRKGSASFRYI